MNLVMTKYYYMFSLDEQLDGIRRLLLLGSNIWAIKLKYQQKQDQKWDDYEMIHV